VEDLFQNGVDILLVASSLPGGNGYEAARAIRERFPSALVIFVASAFEVYDPEKAAASGGDSVLRDPVSAGDILSAVESLLGPLAPKHPTAGETQQHWKQAVPLPAEQLASFLPRGGREGSSETDASEGADFAEVDPALQLAILRAVPQVLEGALRSALYSSPEFRSLIADAVREAIENEKSE
jgi:DNA-binding response OmpR family regulator